MESDSYYGSVLIVLLLCWVMSVPGEAANQASGILAVKDVLALPNHLARIEAQLSGKTPAGVATWAGVPLQLSIDGKPVGTVKTGESGQAIFEYMPLEWQVQMVEGTGEPTAGGK